MNYNPHRQAEELLNQSQAVVISGTKASQQRPLKAIALASLVILASALTATPAHAQRYGRMAHPNEQTTSARVFGQQEALSVQNTSVGEVVAVNRVAIQKRNKVGTVIGALLGGALGSRAGGHGTYRTLATVGGAVGGATIGNRIGKNEHEALEVFVKVVSGPRNYRKAQIISIVQDADMSFQPGQQVFVVGSGPATRIVPMGADATLNKTTAPESSTTTTVEPESLGQTSSEKTDASLRGRLRNSMHHLSDRMRMRRSQENVEPVAQTSSPPKPR